MSFEPQVTGVSWYPEMWPEDQWAGDVAKMRQAGIAMVRVFEFAWHRFEPHEGQFDFGWARRVMDLCQRQGVAVMLGTPSAAPPAWIGGSHPECLRVNERGVRATHGMRHHGSIHSARYRQFIARIVERMAREFGQHPATHSWQIDNEMGGACFSAEGREGFHRWLKERYGSIDELNRRWGLEFWSQAYQSFEQVPLPTATLGGPEIQERHHPSLLFAFSRFTSDAWHRYIAEQCEIIRRHSAVPITTNMTQNLGMDWFRHNRLMDRVGFSIYSDLEHYDWTVERLDRMRPEKPAAYWILETAPNWSGGGRQWNIHHSGAGIRAFNWMTAVLGGSMMLYWQWREHWAGQEMQHGTCVTATGKWRPGVEHWRQTARERAEQAQWLSANPPPPAEVAIMLSPQSAWAFSIDPITDDMRYGERWRNDHYLPLLRHHVWRDIIGPDADLSPHKVLLMPLMPIVPAELRRRLEQWVSSGGRLLLGPLSGYRTEEFTVPLEREYGGLEELIGGEVATRFSAMWIEGTINVDFGDGGVVRPIGFCDGYELKGAEALARYRGGWGDGSVAVMRNRLGAGTVLALGGRVDAAAYWRLVKMLLDEAGVRPLAEGGEGKVIVAPRGRGVGIVNISEQSRRVRLREDLCGRDRLTGRAVGPEVELEALEVMLVER